MKRKSCIWRSYITAALVMVFGAMGLEVPWIQAASDSAVEGTANARYEHRPNDPLPGTGKFYMGREIAHVMGYQGADWLERSAREEQEDPDRLVEALELEEGDVVADIGCGTGYFTRRLAREVGPEGRVYAVDIQPEMLKLLKENIRQAGLDQVKPIRGTVKDPRLPKGKLDLVLMVDVYHEFTYPYGMLVSIRKSLKPDGRVVFAEYRAEDPSIPVKRLHKMTEDQVIREATAAGLKWLGTSEALPRQHLVFFRK